MRARLGHYLSVLALPLTLLLVSLSLRVAWLLFDLPPAVEFAGTVSGWLQAYGLPVLLLCAMLEGMLLVGSYFPGVFIITVSVIVSRSWQEAVVVVVVGSAGTLVAHGINYFLGRHGWYHLLTRFGLGGAIRDARMRLERHGLAAVFTSYWMLSLAALTDTAAGIAGVPFRKFALYSLLGTIFWNSVAGTTMYLLGERAISLALPSSGTDVLFLFAWIAAWSGILIALDARRTRKRRNAALIG